MHKTGGILTEVKISGWIVKTGEFKFERTLKPGQTGQAGDWEYKNMETFDNLIHEVVKQMMPENVRIVVATGGSPKRYFVVIEGI